MIDKTTIITHAKSILVEDNAANATQDAKIERAFLFALADISNRMLEKDRLAKETVDVTANDREVTLQGANSDLAHIYYILYGTGEDQVMLEYVDEHRFLRDYYQPDADAGTPSRYSYVGLSGGYPRIRFDVPAKSTTTMEVWYYQDINENLINDSKAPVLVNLTVAYFYGLGSEKGAPYYGQALSLVNAWRAATSRKIVDKETKFRANEADMEISDARASRRNSR